MHTVHAEPQHKIALLFDSHRAKLHSSVRSIVRNQLLTEETVSDLRFQLLQSAASFDLSRPFEPWARSIAYRVAVAALKKHQRHEHCLAKLAVDSLAAALDSINAATQLDPRADALPACLDKLPPDQRQLIEDRIWHDLEYARISHRTGKSVPALQAAFKRTLLALNRCVSRNTDRP